MEKWLSTIRQTISEIEEVLKGLEEPLKTKAFEILLQRVVDNPNTEIQVRPTRMEAESASVASPVKYQAFLDKLGESEEALRNIMDFDTGYVYMTQLGATKAEKQKTLAALIAIRHLRLEGNARIPKEELVAQCKEHDAYDSTNFSTHMRTHKLNNARVFQDEAKHGWSVTRPGEAYLVSRVRDLLPRSG